ncbi:MAG: hypothetical protein RR348_01710 [Clostridia bacterium]
MNKIICKKEYDTEKATLVKKVVSGEFGDETGFEEDMYKMKDGSAFLYVNGGAKSKYPKEDIKRMSKENAEVWLKENN